MATVHHPVTPTAYDCVKVIVVRDGSAVLFSEFGQKPVKVSDVILLGVNVLCGSEPEDHITTTTIYAAYDQTVYGTLRRLFQAGLLTTYVVPSDEGPHRKYYSLNAAGRAQLDRSAKIWRSFSSTMDSLLDERGTAA